MSSLPDEAELKRQILSHISTEVYEQTLAEVRASHPIYKTKPLLALPMVAKKHNIKLVYNLKDAGKRFTEEEILPVGQFIKIKDAINGAYKMFNIKGWIIGKSKLTKTKGDKPKSMLMFNIADDTASLQIGLFGEPAEEFANDINFNIGSPYSIVKMTKSEGKGANAGKIYYNINKTTTMVPYREKDICPLGEVATPALANLAGEYCTVKGFIMSDPEEITRIGCDKYHALQAAEGETIPCEKCKGIPKVAQQIKSAHFALADASAQIIVDVPAWVWASADTRFQLNNRMGDYLLIDGKYDVEREMLTFNRAVTIPLTAATNTLTAATSVPQQQEYADYYAIWKLVRDQQNISRKVLLAEHKCNEAKVDNLIKWSVISEPKNDGRYRTFWDKWEDVLATLKESDPVAQAQPLTIADYISDEEESREMPDEEALKAFTDRFKTTVRKYYDTILYSDLVTVIAKHAGGQNYKTAPFVERLLAEKLVELTKQGTQPALRCMKK